MNRKIAVCFGILSALSAFAVTPTVTVVSIAQSSNNRAVTIKYDLADAPGIVTCDITTNGVSIGVENLTHFSGDVNKLVQNGTGKEIVWHPDKAWPDQICDIQAVVTAWEPSTPPDVMVVDLLDNSVNYYTDVKCLTGGVAQNPVYSTTKLVLRKIHAKDVPWTMGCTQNEPGFNSSYCEYVHNVALDKDYYIGVFEVTQYQWNLVCGNWPSYHKNVLYRERRPVENVSYRQIRDYIYNKTDGSTGTNEWPADPHAQSFFGKLRTRTGLAFDLPGEAQWEFACRAGTGDMRWNDGSLIVAAMDEDENLNRLARYKANANGGTTSEQADLSIGTTVVGSYEPNAWGIYDMHGNAQELCLDWYSTQTGDPALDISEFDGQVNCDGVKAAVDGNNGRHKVIRGGSFGSDPQRCRSASRINHVGTWSGTSQTGFRVCLPVE